jgi:ferredoxin
MQDKEILVGKYKIQVIKDDCIGAASCVAVSPSVFKLGQDKKALVIEGSFDEADNILTAAQSCPTKAIVVTDVETGKQVWPE